MTHLITGATGDVGSRVVNHLLKREIRPRILARNEAKARLRFGEAVDIFAGDLSDPASFRKALEGSMLSSSSTSVRRSLNEMKGQPSSQKKGVKKIVKLSSLDVEHGLAIGAWHEKGEAAIRPSVFPSPSCVRQDSCQIC